MLIRKSIFNNAFNNIPRRFSSSKSISLKKLEKSRVMLWHTHHYRFGIGWQKDRATGGLGFFSKEERAFIDKIANHLKVTLDDHKSLKQIEQEFTEAWLNKYQYDSSSLEELFYHDPNGELPAELSPRSLDKVFSHIHR